MYSLPAENDWDWEAGTYSGVTGGIDQYRPGGANERTNLLDLTLAPYYVNLANPATTGTIAAGDDVITVADPTDFRVNDFVKIEDAYPEQAQLVVTSAATADGNVVITLSGLVYTIPILDVDTINEAATKIRDHSYPGQIGYSSWTTSGSGDTIIFTANDDGPQYTQHTYNSGPAGFAATASTPIIGALYGTHQITGISGDEITITPARVASSGATDAVFQVDTARSIDNAIVDAEDEDVIYFPAGDYHIDRVIYLNTSNITFRGDGQGISNILTDTTSPAFSVGSGFSYNGTSTTVTGTKAFKQTALTVTSPTGFATGQMVELAIENETDNTRIIAGAIPRFYVDGTDEASSSIVLITDVTGSVITIFPGLPFDCTNYAVQLTNMGGVPSFRLSNIGWESLTFDGNAVNATMFQSTHMDNCWLYDVEVKDFNNYGIFFGWSYRCQVEKCIVGPGRAGGSNSAGILNDTGTANLFANNIIKAVSSSTQQNAGSLGNVWAYNFYDYNPTGNVMLISHSSGNCQNLYEGNIAMLWKADGYFGCCFLETMFRNWFTASNNEGTLAIVSMAANRFTRNFAQVGNVYGWDGVVDDTRSYGNPNIGNGAAIGFAGPTGLSDQEGQPDYSQPGYGENEYIIQAEDIFEGDFWVDWKMTGTMTTRVSDTEAIFTMSGGYFIDNGTQITTTIYWNSRANRRTNMEVTNVSGLSITLSSNVNTGGDVLPTNGTVVDVWMGSQGWQERDLDVKPSFTEDHNYLGNAEGVGSVENPTIETLPDSFVYPSQPSWWAENSFGGNWPAINPDDPEFDITIIPAGYRFFYDGEYPSGSDGANRIFRSNRIILIRRR